MKFGQFLQGGSVPEWRQCYLDYEHLKIYVILIKKIVELIHAITFLRQKKGDHNTLAPENVNLMVAEEGSFHEEPETHKIYQQLHNILEGVNKLFYEAHRRGIEINRNFTHMKLLEVNKSFEKCKIMKRMDLEKDEKELLVNLMEFVYVEISYLDAMKEMNLEAERKILKKHKKYAAGVTSTPYVKNRRYTRLGKCINKTLNEVEDVYAKYGEGKSKDNRENLRKLALKHEIETTDSFIFGGWVGICFTVVVVVVIILSYNDLSIEHDPVFNRDFPTWRGIAFFIFYIWILGFNTYNFEKFSVSHRIIMNFNEHHYCTSTQIFKVAGFFSTFFLVMFTIYVLNISGIATLGSVRPGYLVAFVWGLLILFLFNPLPFLYWKSRLFSFKLVLISAFSPFLGVTFPVIWATDQLISLVTPFKDFGYTVCYYQELDLTEKVEASANTCSSSTRIGIVFVVGAVAYSYRIVQCIRQGYDKGAYFLKPEFFNTIKYSSSLLTLVLSYIWKAGSDQVFSGWLFCTIFTTIYSYIWDLKMDWALFEPGSPNRFLRKNLTYLPARNYYAIMIANLVLRLAWVATLSPAIADNFFGSPQIFSLVTGALQIFRRGLWNLLRVEKEHLANCQNFQAVPDTSKHLQLQIIDKIQKNYSLNDKKSFEQRFIKSVFFLSINILLEKTEKQQATEKNAFLDVLHKLLNNEQKMKKKRKKQIQEYKERVKAIHKEVEAQYNAVNLKMPEIGNDDDD